MSNQPIHSFNYDFETRPMPTDFLVGLHGELKAENVEVPQKHAKNSEAYIKAKLAEYVPDLISNAAKHPMTAEIAAAGYLNNRYGFIEIVLGSEKEIIEDFFARFELAQGAGEKLTGFNNFDYDCPVALAAARRTGTPVPRGFVGRTASGYTYFPGQIDLEVEYTGDPRDMLKLEKASFASGGPKKVGSGKFFAQLYDSGDPEKRAEAIDYLARDVVMPAYVHNALVASGELDLAAAVIPPAILPGQGQSFVVEPIVRTWVCAGFPSAGAYAVALHEASPASKRIDVEDVSFDHASVLDPLSLTRSQPSSHPVSQVLA